MYIVCQFAILKIIWATVLRTWRPSLELVLLWSFYVFIYLRFILFCIYICFAYMYFMCTTFMPGQEGNGFPWTRVTDGHEQPWICWESYPGLFKSKVYSLTLNNISTLILELKKISQNTTTVDVCWWGNQTLAIKVVLFLF